VNQLLLSARIAEAQPPRSTPAGLTAIDLLLEHESQATEGGVPRQVRATLRAVAFGEVAQRLQSLALGTEAAFSGFLAAAPRNAKGIVLHIQSFELT
jgi:primosomal replication protein N